MASIEFEIYQDNNGTCPFEDWYHTLPSKDARKLDALIDRIQNYGIATSLKMQWVKKLNSDIWEIRSQCGNNIQRVCYFHCVGNRYVITHGFTKKTQRTPVNEISKALSIKKHYESRGSE